MIDNFLLQFISSYYLQILTFIGIFTILSISLDIVNGYTGQFSIGHAGFMAVGAYASAYLTFYYSLPFVPAMLFGAVVAGIFGLIIGIPTLRLRGDYLAIATLGFAEIIRVVLLNIEKTGGARGFAGIPQMTNFGSVFIVTLISFVLLYNFTRSAYGRALLSIREDEIAAECTGVPSTYFKVLAFFLAAMFAGVAGALYAHYLMFLHPNDFGLLRSIEILLMIVLGGMGNLWGAFLGAVVLSILPESLRTPGGVTWTLIIIFLFGLFVTIDRAKRSGWKYWVAVASSFVVLVVLLTYGRDVLVQYAGQMRMIIYSMLLIIMMIFKPEGLIGAFKFRLPSVRKQDERVA